MNMIESLVIQPNVYYTLEETAHKEETLNQHVADWLAASTPSLEDIWDNEEDAVYDNLTQHDNKYIQLTLNEQ